MSGSQLSILSEQPIDDDNDDDALFVLVKEEENTIVKKLKQNKKKTTTTTTGYNKNKMKKSNASSLLAKNKKIIIDANSTNDVQQEQQQQQQPSTSSLNFCPKRIKIIGKKTDNVMPQVFLNENFNSVDANFSKSRLSKRPEQSPIYIDVNEDDNERILRTSTTKQTTETKQTTNSEAEEIDEEAEIMHTVTTTTTTTTTTTEIEIASDNNENQIVSESTEINQNNVPTVVGTQTDFNDANSAPVLLLEVSAVSTPNIYSRSSDNLLLNNIYQLNNAFTKHISYGINAQNFEANFVLRTARKEITMTWFEWITLYALLNGSETNRANNNHPGEMSLSKNLQLTFTFLPPTCKSTSNFDSVLFKYLRTKIVLDRSEWSLLLRHTFFAMKVEDYCNLVGVYVQNYVALYKLKYREVGRELLPSEFFPPL